MYLYFCICVCVCVFAALEWKVLLQREGGVKQNLFQTDKAASDICEGMGGVLSSIIQGRWWWSSPPSPPPSLWEKLEDTVRGLRATLDNIDKPLHVILENNIDNFEEEDCESREGVDISSGVIEKFLKIGNLPDRC